MSNFYLIIGGKMNKQSNVSMSLSSQLKSIIQEPTNINMASLQHKSKGNVSNKFLAQDISISESKGIGHSMYLLSPTLWQMLISIIVFTQWIRFRSLMRTVPHCTTKAQQRSRSSSLIISRGRACASLSRRL